MRTLLLALAISLSFAGSALAQDAKPGAKAVPPGVMAQVVLSEQLIALGTARNDAHLLLAAMRLRSDVSDEMPAIGGEVTSDEALDAALAKAVAGNDALTGVAEDVKASRPRAFHPNCFMSGGVRVCY
ncbi:hypothetical protein [Ahrensia sp. R2A130]|uniref:hypothetical protein n=1 Tax=Ahrensia sp. R2A130 TaxID=744979 RepID=UPI0001E08C67|nr:hypothetical protein [Ahrensia sp. R2A130]EFL88529.1 conserved hypothetical protein [Ahrensia sp. R2A130]